MNVKDASLKNIGNAIKNAASDLLTNNDFISRTIGMTASYDDIMFIVQSLGREPISLLGKDYSFIFDHVRRNFQQGVSVSSMVYGGGEYGCPKFTFYKDPPTVRFADPYQDPLRLLDRWTPNMEFGDTGGHEGNAGHGVTKHYSESNDGVTNNKKIDLTSDLYGGNPGTYFGAIESYGPELPTCDLIKKTNTNFNHGKYKTLIARFHTNSEDSRSGDNPTQTAISNQYGMSHGRNLLKVTPTTDNGYDNPYCRVWTYHHQYNQIGRLIRPFGDDYDSADKLESAEMGSHYGDGGFRTIGDADFDGGSSRLDKYGVLNYKNGFVNIAPTAKIKDYFDGKENDEAAVSIKKCMFSIENLAWRDDKMKMKEYDQYGLSPEQKGPLGGRIMWFPPYDLTFSEDVSVDWNGNKFIGRGEQIYTYTNTERRGNLSFTLLIDHPSILDYWTGHQRNGMKNNGKELLEGNTGGVDQLDNQENTLLRFFAGCSILTAAPQAFYKAKGETKVEEEKKDPTPEPEVVTSDETPSKTPKKIQVLLFYPNNYSGKDDGGIVNPIYYLMNGIGTQKRVNEITKNADDFAADIQHSVYCSIGSGYGGYEMGTKGISVATDVLQANHNIIKTTYADLESTERKAQYLTKGDGTKVNAWYDGGEPAFGATTLAKIIGDKAMSLGNAYGKNLTGEDHLWYRKRYYYRVDKAYENQDFSNSDSYLDTNSNKLNSTGYASARNIKEFEIEDESDTFNLISFSDLFAALESSNKVVPSTNKSEEIKKILTDKDRYEITGLKYFGHASYQGRKDSNNDLAKNRANTLKKWLEGFEEFKGVKVEQPQIKNQTEKPVINAGHNSELNTKLWRSASVIIEYNELSVSKAVETPAKQNIDKVEIPNGKTSNKLSNLSVSGFSSSASSILSDPKSDPMNYRFDAKAGKFVYVEPKEPQPSDTTETGVVQRYDNEGEFFELLDKEAPFLHHLISEKIRYFDPAFHSISPEGFNSRLTFLHQCTRQGATIEHGSANEISAYNLAFGRPPICVLRLGDFYYTKIIVNSLSIQYETPQWDLNPEGIGVMPMFAKITMSFTFLGGSDLAGPIARLQNAVSFNYYANAGVYDNRAEMVEYEPNGSGRPKKFKGYVYPNLPARKPIVQVEDVTLSDFMGDPKFGQGARNVQAGAKETINYQVDENGNRI